ncbi:RsmB/NOP family class I SAM-dependent RNA methyltransferase [Candidatus Allofournierella excrementavium]|uniref:RsmB/NOP family class I SAM-dependent RNA methyltransferase n=1 Tax=Candidatus Allofournierella excrementavium TaxID=2838591 RepID=UPI003A89DAF1
MYPEYFEARERALLGERFDALFAASEAPARGLTVNGLRCTPDWLARRLNVPLTPSPFCEAGFVLGDRELRLGKHPYHHGGAIYLQEPSASAPAALLEVQPGQRVLDMCAAPGGKSSQLAAALKGQGVLVSNEYEPARAQALMSNLERMGPVNSVITTGDTARLAAALPGWFDRVLVDAPCSGEGLFRKEPQAVAQHSPALVARCAALGAEILENAATVLAPGGLLVYSTCTFAPEEDEGQIGHFLALHPEFELLDCGVSFGAPGEENRCGEHPFPAGLTRRIWPAQGGEGHFMAKLRKSPDAPAAVSKRTKPARPPKPCAEWLAFAAEYFPALKEQSAQAAGERLFLPPQGWQGEGLKLSIARCGVTLGRAQKGRFEPDHHLFMAFGPECENREELTLNDPRTEAWLRGEEIEAVTAKNGWCAVLVDGLPLGGGKVSGDRVKNHYPKALRNLK